LTAVQKPSDKLLAFVVPQENIEAQLEDWIRKVFESNDELVAALSAFASPIARYWRGVSL
jgi:hypothetical protein